MSHDERRRETHEAAPACYPVATPDRPPREAIVKLTQRAVTALPTDGPDRVIWDSDLPGFGCRIRGGRKSYLIQYRIAGQQRRESLGDTRKVACDAAHSIARKRFAMIELGEDPAANRIAAKAAAAAPKLTLGLIADRYFESRRAVLRATAAKEMQRYFTVAWAPLRDHPVDGITRAHVAAELQTITKTTGPVAAARARAYLAAAFAWGMREGLCDSNPLLGTNNPADGIKSRDRVLSDAELRIVWNACDRDSNFDKIVRLLILLGCRRQEIGSLKWNELDLDAGPVTIPGKRTKSGNTLELALPGMALEILRSVPRRDDGDFVFGAAGFVSWSMAVSMLRKRMAGPMAPWVLHDLRRSFRSGLGRIGVLPHIAERLVGHSVGGTNGKIYDRHTYRAEMRNALLRWADHVLVTVEGRGGKVVSMHA
jgi:integrase